VSQASPDDVVVTIVIDMLGGNCPVQGEGTINGKPFYFWSRGASWALNIGGADVVADPEWRHVEGYGTWPDAGWITAAEARTFIEAAARLYVVGAE
jgi:hypothetical protein